MHAESAFSITFCVEFRPKSNSGAGLSVIAAHLVETQGGPLCKAALTYIGVNS